MKEKQLLFSISSKDLKIEMLKGSGPGGQNRNKRQTAIRITHIPSGAIGWSCDQRSQAQNKKIAFQRLTENPKLKTWIRIQAAAIMEGYSSIEKKVDDMMQPQNIKIEFIEKENED